MVWIISLLINKAHNLRKTIQKMKFVKKKVSTKNTEERQYSLNYFFGYKNNTAAETDNICDKMFVL